MDKQELKMRLAACRPSGQDNNEAVIREALELLPGDAEMAVWFAKSQALDSAIARQLGGIDPPAGLRERILAGQKVGARRQEWRRLFWLAAAAVVMAGVAVWTMEKPLAPSSGIGGPLTVASLREYRDDVASVFINMNKDGFDLDHSDSDVVKVKAWLAEHGAPGDAVLRAGLNDAMPYGCKIIDWRGRKVSMMCFGKHDDEAHLFVVNREAIRDLGGLEAGRIERIGGLQVIAWQDDKRAYVMVGNSETTELKDFL